MLIASATQMPIVGTSPQLQDVPTSAVSWSAIFAGAAGAAALSLILLMLGTGLGLSSVSPWVQSGISAKALGVSSIVWITFTQLTAAALGGYLAGRLRTKWLSVPVDEVHFRDTAHGFLAWAVATLFTAALLTSTISALLSSTTDGAIAALNSPGPAKRGVEQLERGGMRYQLDKLFRQPIVSATDSVAEPISQDFSDEGAHRVRSTLNRSGQYRYAEVSRIFANAQARGTEGSKTLPTDDLNYVTGLVEQHTGLSQIEAQKRVRDSYILAQTQAEELKASAKLLADQTRKVAANASLWLFISLLIGAFIASLTATLGARHRDD